ncbi:unnamed protein product [Heterotrigona itama]|uniref:Invertebrate defensins family profile domain-containing protein n=1 Tax=Heterotrigona itama TaxID=395501 RepID=A0A6V7GYP4_9HYME|nr:unnamed protein product [Heterotrigona itama]
MKVLVLVSVLATVVYVSGAVTPDVIYDDPIYELREIEGTENEAAVAVGDVLSDLAPLRHRRATCDVVFSFQSKRLSVNHSACTVRCLAQRRKGTCRNGVCICHK